MSNKRRYTVRDIPINCNEPLQIVAQLASSTTDSPYVVYEGEETWHYAAGIAAEVILTAEKCNYSLAIKSSIQRSPMI